MTNNMSIPVDSAVEDFYKATGGQSGGVDYLPYLRPVHSDDGPITIGTKLPDEEEVSSLGETIEAQVVAILSCYSSYDADEGKNVLETNKFIQGRQDIVIFNHLDGEAVNLGMSKDKLTAYKDKMYERGYPMKRQMAVYVRDLKDNTIYEIYVTPAKMFKCSKVNGKFKTDWNDILPRSIKDLQQQTGANYSLKKVKIGFTTYKSSPTSTITYPTFEVMGDLDDKDGTKYLTETLKKVNELNLYKWNKLGGATTDVKKEAIEEFPDTEKTFADMAKEHKKAKEVVAEVKDDLPF